MIISCGKSPDLSCLSIFWPTTHPSFVRSRTPLQRPIVPQTGRAKQNKHQRPPRLSNITESEAWHEFRCRAEERKLPCPKPLRALRIPRRVVLRSGSTFHEETALRLLRRMRNCLLYTSPSPRDGLLSRMPSSA